ncbi:MAG: alpha-beta hydrolase superfamily lysophospholipase [Kiritimatiellia bacterium]|jgi:alpha-beta hydrolase superfamily lysophospholipase
MSDMTQREGSFETRTGGALFYRCWIPEQTCGRGVVLLHRGHEHSGRMAELVDALELEGVHVFAYDMRGHGRSPGLRGHANRFQQHVEDLEFFVRMIEQEYGIVRSDLFVLANSVSAVTATTWVHDYAPGIRGMALAAPAFKINLYVPFATAGLRVLNRFRRNAFIKSYVKPQLLTHDPEQVRAYRDDPLITSQIAVNVLLGLLDTATRLIADAGTITTPTLLLSAENDVVVNRKAQQRFFERLGSQEKRWVSCPGAYHAVYFEQDRSRALEETQTFMQACFNKQQTTHAVTATTATEYERLCQPARPLASIGFALQRLAMRGPGRLSRGVRIGLATGFDSGQSLDYVYENEARGVGLIGRLIDRGYLNAVGWKGIRTRREHLRKVLCEAIQEREGELQLIDLATGCGRYVLETLHAMPQAQVKARLRDWSEANLVAGQQLADRFGLEDIAFEKADAFDENGLRALAGQMDIAVVSGLYELFPDNEMITASLRGVAAALKEDGTLIYTCQPWHPQLEMIARILPNREGNPWIMRRRTQAEMDALVRAAGFEKCDMHIDPDGIFTVSVARRIGRRSQEDAA